MVRTITSARDKRGGEVWSREEYHSERDAEAFGEIALVLTHCNVQFQHTCEQCGENLCCPRFQPETTFVFCSVIPKHNNAPGPRPCEAVPPKSGFSARPTSTIHAGVPESEAREHDEAS